MKKIYSVLATILTAGALMGPPSVSAIPTLQLDIAGGYYDLGSETIVASGPTFTLWALLNPNGNDNNVQLSATTLLADTYYISVALMPKIDSPQTLGSFQFDGNPIMATGGMTFGTPPLNDPADGDNPDSDLAPHGIFATYYSEFAFQFDQSKEGIAYNTADNPGGLVGGSGTGFYWMAFSVDKSLLDPGYELHFDLYNTVTKENRQGEDLQAGLNAPFSHDAQSGPGAPVPEPATMLLFGTGLAGLAGIARRKVQ